MTGASWGSWLSGWTSWGGHEGESLEQDGDAGTKVTFKEPVSQGRFLFWLFAFYSEGAENWSVGVNELNKLVSTERKMMMCGVALRDGISRLEVDGRVVKEAAFEVVWTCIEKRRGCRGG